MLDQPFRLVSVTKVVPGDAVVHYDGWLLVVDEVSRSATEAKLYGYPPHRAVSKEGRRASMTVPLLRGTDEVRVAPNPAEFQQLQAALLTMATYAGRFAEQGEEPRDGEYGIAARPFDVDGQHALIIRNRAGEWLIPLMRLDDGTVDAEIVEEGDE